MRYRRKIGWCLAVVIVALAAASGAITASQAQQLSDAKGDAKSEAAPDLSTVRSAALAWIDASWAGNAPVAYQVLVDDEQQRQFMTGLLRFAAALRVLESAAVKQFGEPGRQVTGYPDGSAKAVEKDLKIQQDGDRASATLGQAVLPLQLRRIDGKWRVDLSETSRDPRARRSAQSAVAATQIAQDLAAEIDAGKFKSAEEAKAAFRDRRLAAAKQ